MTFAAFAFPVVVCTLLVLAFHAALVWRIDRDDRGRK
jgi:hypothetical protein